MSECGVSECVILSVNDCTVCQQPLCDDHLENACDCDGVSDMMRTCLQCVQICPRCDGPVCTRCGTVCTCTDCVTPRYMIHPLCGECGV